MSNNVNYNYAFLFYDIEEKRVSKVFKICKKYFKHHQRSVFRGNITTSNLIKLREELKTVVNTEKDFVSIIKILNKASFEEESIGKNFVNSESIIL